MIKLMSSQKGFSALILIIIIVVLLLLAGGFWFLSQNKSTANIVSPVTKQLNALAPSPTPSIWNTFTDQEYGFEVTYPKVGVIVNEDGFTQGVCGNAIKTNQKGVNNIIIDNFFGIKIVPWEGSIAAYMKSQAAANKYNIQVINGSGADEAIALKGLKQNVEYARGYPPLAYVVALYKKGDNLFLMQTFQNPGNFGGCIDPSLADAALYPDIAKQKWNMVESLKFAKPTSTTLANPASVNCQAKGGILTIATNGSGGQYGVCNFEDNQQCEEWALFRGDCPVGGVKITGFDTPQQTFCAISGGQTTTNPGAVCTFNDGTKCGLDALYNGTCAKGV